MKRSEKRTVWKMRAAGREPFNSFEEHLFLTRYFKTDFHFKFVLVESMKKIRMIRCCKQSVFELVCPLVDIQKEMFAKQQ